MSHLIFVPFNVNQKRSLIRGEKKDTLQPIDVLQELRTADNLRPHFQSEILLIALTAFQLTCCNLCHFCHCPPSRILQEWCFERA